MLNDSTAATVRTLPQAQAMVRKMRLKAADALLPGAEVGKRGASTVIDKLCMTVYAPKSTFAQVCLLYWLGLRHRVSDLGRAARLPKPTLCLIKSICSCVSGSAQVDTVMTNFEQPIYC
jgi:hypothetical protein